MSIVDTSKDGFIKAWPLGYRENWRVYGKASGVSEEAFEARCLAPFYNKDATCLEVGCGGGFWTDKYLAPNFEGVFALDVLPKPTFDSDNVVYIEVPDRTYDCGKLLSESIDFAWSFGVFCHLTPAAIEQYLRGIYRVLRPGGQACLYFANADRRPNCATEANTKDDLLWVHTTLQDAFAMLERAGFTEILDRMPELPDSMVSCRKPPSALTR